MDATTTTCPVCHEAVPAGKRFCGNCGTPLALHCSVCGAQNRPGVHFCEECGSPLHAAAATLPSGMPAPVPPAPRVGHPGHVTDLPGEERRLVTALFCDLVGFTPLSEHLDPEDVRDLQSEYFQAMAERIERYGGTVQKYIGDAVVALFGAPVAHEDDAERAVVCALDMQEAILEVASDASRRWGVEPAIRVGVNTGEVISGTWNVSGREDVDVTGDAVNTAARLQTAADPGEVLVGQETMRLTRRRIEYGERRELVLKGKAGIIPGYPALRVREQFGERWETSSHATPLVGRDRELQDLLDGWAIARAGEGQLLTVVGDAGVGKSRLIAEMLEQATRGTAVRVVRGRCLSYDQEIPLWLVADLLRSLFNIVEGDALEQVRIKLRTGVAGLLQASDAATRAEVLDVLGEVLGLPIGESIVAQAGAEVRRQALIRDLRLVLRALSERAAAIVVLEDLHWIDEASAQVLTEVLADVPGLRLMVLAAQRPGWTAPWTDWGWTVRLTLRALREDDATRLAGAVLGGKALAPELERHVADRAGGNPFFVEEMLRALEESGGLEQRDGQVALASGAAERLPSTLTEVLLARLDRLEGQARGVARVASVIGRSFAVRLLAHITEQEVLPLEGPLTVLQRAEIAFPRRGSDLEYVFKHVSMRDVAYNTLVQKRRQELHLATARAIAALYPAPEYVEIIAYHYGRTQEHREAAEWLERAGDHAAAVYANESAINQFGEARRRLEQGGADDPDLVRLDEKLGETLLTAGRYDEALPVLERAIQLYRELRDLEGAGRSAALLGRAHLMRGVPQDGLARVQPMVEMLAWIGPSAALASLHIALAAIFQVLGRYGEMLEAAERAAEIAGAIGDERLRGWALTQRGSALTSLGRSSEARVILEEAIPLLEHAGNLTTLQLALGTLGEVHRLAGQMEEARRYNQRALTVSEQVGNPFNVAFYLMNLGEILLTLGQWQEAHDYLTRADTVLATLSTASSHAPYVRAMTGEILLHTGNWVEAETQLRQALELAGHAEDRHVLELIHLALAELEMLRGDPKAAIVRLESLERREGGHSVPVQIQLSWAALESGYPARAGDLAAEAVRRARAQSEMLTLVDALRVQGMVLRRRGQPDEATVILEEALGLARSLPYPYAEARILEELGRREEALPIFRRLGAARDVERTASTPS